MAQAWAHALMFAWRSGQHSLSRPAAHEYFPYREGNVSQEFVSVGGCAWEKAIQRCQQEPSSKESPWWVDKREIRSRCLGLPIYCVRSR